MYHHYKQISFHCEIMKNTLSQGQKYVANNALDWDRKEPWLLTAYWGHLGAMLFTELCRLCVTNKSAADTIVLKPSE